MRFTDVVCCMVILAAGSCSVISMLADNSALEELSGTIAATLAAPAALCVLYLGITQFAGRELAAA